MCINYPRARFLTLYRILYFKRSTVLVLLNNLLTILFYFGWFGEKFTIFLIRSLFSKCLVSLFSRWGEIHDYEPFTQITQLLHHQWLWQLFSCQMYLSVVQLMFLFKFCTLAWLYYCQICQFIQYSHMITLPRYDTFLINFKHFF